MSSGSWLHRGGGGGCGGDNNVHIRYTKYLKAKGCAVANRVRVGLKQLPAIKPNKFGYVCDNIGN